MAAANRILLLNKPFGVLSKFLDEQGRPTLASLVSVPDVYPVGRLDADSEGLLLLTDRKSLVEPLLIPGGKEKRYLVCVEGQPGEDALEKLRQGVTLKDGPTLPARVRLAEEPSWLWERHPPIRYRKSIPTCWLELVIKEGRNRQVRRMTAAVGFPTLRLVRLGFGPLSVEGLGSGQWREANPEERRWLLEWETRFKGEKVAGKRSSPRPDSGPQARPGRRSGAASKKSVGQGRTDRSGKGRRGR